MTKTDIQVIENFIKEEIKEYDISYDFEIEDDTMEVTFSGHFFNNEKVCMTFKGMEQKPYFYLLSESYGLAETRSFWITLMAKWSGK